MIIETVAVYRVKGDTSRKTYRTYEGAVGRLAWMLIFDKYYFQMNYTNAQPMHPFDENALEKIPGNLDCDCASREDLHEDGLYYESWVGCPIHDRQTGYFRRLHDRLVRYILIKYPMPRLATVQQS